MLNCLVPTRADYLNDIAMARPVIPFWLGSFEINGRETWQLYKIRLQATLRAAGITTDDSKKDALLAICDTYMFQLMASLCRPQNVYSPEVTFADILVRSDQYFKVNVSEPQATQAFHRRKQNPGEKAQKYLAALRQLAGPCNFTDYDRSLTDQRMFGCLDEECAAELDTNVTSTWKVAEVSAVMSVPIRLVLPGEI